MNAMLMNLGLAPIPRIKRQRDSYEITERKAICAKALEASCAKRAAERDGRKAEVLAAITGTTLSAVEIAAIIGMHRMTTREYLRELLADGLVTRNRYSNKTYYWSRNARA